MAAPQQGRLDELGRGLLRIGARDQGRDLFVVDEVGHAVAAQQDPVTVLQQPGVPRRGDVDGRIAGRTPAERAGDDVRQRGLARLLGGELPRLDELLHQLVVARAVDDALLPDEVGPAVADPRHVGHGVAHVGHHGGGAGLLHVFAQRDADLLVGLAQRHPHALGRQGLGRQRLVEVHRLAQDVDGELARLVAPAHAPHAVADDEERAVARGDHGVGVLVAQVVEPGVGGRVRAEGLQRWRGRFQTGEDSDEAVRMPLPRAGDRAG
ncbi:MAG: hypothetical protein R3F59_37715 [Myxococcota bacterium]